MIGPPGLELARANEYFDRPQEFFKGYDSSSDVFHNIPDAARILFCIDTAVMLAVVGLSEMPDPVFAAQKLNRLRSLCAMLQ